nr:BPK_HP1_G0043050.mRNA.1.CDS.1 [Saccharomyces cerevisiae]
MTPPFAGGSKNEHKASTLRKASNNMNSTSPALSHSILLPRYPIVKNNSGIFSYNTANNSRVSSSDEFTTQQDGMNTIMYKNNISKTFEDDIFYCPRSLLTPEEQVVYQEIDKYYMEQALLTQLQISQTYSSTPKEEKIVKFNPYTSKSFSPASSE